MKYFILLFTVFFSVSVFSKTIEFYFPNYANKEYVVSLNKGSFQDTIQTGVLDDEGRFVLIVPERANEYAGIVNWNIGEGGGMGFIMDKGNFAISCTVPEPSGQDIVFSNTEENAFLKDIFLRQSTLLKKIDVINGGKEAYSDDKTLYRVFEKEMLKLKKGYDNMYKELNQSKLYAARYFRLTGFLNGVKPYLVIDDNNGENKDIEDALYYINEEVDLETVYTSGLWYRFINYITGYYPDEEAYGKGMIKLLDRTPSREICEAFLKDAIVMSKEHKLSVLEEIFTSRLSSLKEKQD